ncbi:hypothetical protein CIK05_10360 [Bdellovibrio sp. qaytius]|nr:hypothetical protein CIK05_10360 [Bdellovibrio sp. qaytius]
MKNIISLILLISVKAFSQAQPSPQLDLYMRQMYAQQLAQQQQQQLQTATINPADRLRILQAVNMGNQQYAMQFVPQSGPNMGQTMWSSYNANAQNPLFNFFSAMNTMTKFPDRAERMEAREPIQAFRSPDPEERREPSREALNTMNQATSKLNDIKNPQKVAECLECKTEAQPTLLAGAVSGKGTIKTSASGQMKEDLNADIKCSFGGDVTDGIRLTFAATLEAKIEHNKVVSFKYATQDGKKSCVVDLASYPQKQIGNTSNVILQHPNQKTFVAIYPNNKSPDRKNPSVSIGVSNFQDVCPQMNQKLFMQIEADPKTGTCR